MNGSQLTKTSLLDAHYNDEDVDASMRALDESDAPTRRRVHSATSDDEIYHETAIIAPSESTPVTIMEAQTETSNVGVVSTASSVAFSGEMAMMTALSIF